MGDIYTQAQDLAARAESLAVDAAALRDALADQPAADDTGKSKGKREQTGVRDMNGRKLAVGDKVRVTGSSRYGTVEGVVKGGQPSDGYDKERVVVAIDGNPEYTPSTGRVERLEKATA